MLAKNDPTGLNVHKKIKHLVTNYGAMVTGVPPEIIGQNAAEISIGAVEKTGNIMENIGEVVRDSELTQPTNSCGEASNEVCVLLLGIGAAKEFENAKYQLLSNDGTNLKNSLPNQNLLVRVEMDRYNAPIMYKKVKRAEFNPNTPEKNKVYLLEDQLLFLDEFGKILDLGQDPAICKQLFDAITSYTHYSLNDPFMKPGFDPEEDAICMIGDIFKEKTKNVDFWTGSHSFTIYAPMAEENTPRTLHPYQAYWTKHTLQTWFEGNKDEKLSQLGFDKYIEQLTLMGTTDNWKVRSNTYAELFSPPGKEKSFCVGINEKRNPLRVKFKVTEVNPEIALENLESIQHYIDENYPGNSAEIQCDIYKTKAQNAMTKHLENLLIQQPAKQESIPPTRLGKSQHSFFHAPTKSIEEVISSLVTKEDRKVMAKKADNLSLKERDKLVEYFKMLPQEELADLKDESNTAQKAWDEQYGLILRKSLLF